MSIKRMSLRFNLDNESDRMAWEHEKHDEYAGSHSGIEITPL